MAGNLAVAKRELFRAFKLRGLSIRADAVDALISVLSREEEPSQALEVIMGAIREKIDRRELKSNLVDIKTIEAVVLDLSKDEEEISQESIQLYDAYSMPRLSYDPTRKAFSFTVDPKRRLHSDPVARARMFRDRYLLVQQRILRHEAFSAPVVRSSRKDYLRISTIESLLGTTGVKCLLGVITQVEEGEYRLEDLTSQVPIDLSQAQIEVGIFTENSIVVAEGEMVDGIFRVHILAFPPSETREKSLNAIRSIEFFGTGATPQQVEQLQALESEAHDVMLILLSDVHLDRPSVMDKLKVLFRGYDGLEGAKCIFVLMGNFTAKPVMHDQHGRQQLKGYFEALAALLKESRRLCKEARFIFVPGPQDPGAGSTLPRAPLPSFFLKPLVKVLQHVDFTSNPCKLRVFTQELLLFREDILRKMLRHCIAQGKPSDTQDGPELLLSEQLVKTLLDQGHLCPLPLSARPIHWEYDNALRIYPLPDVLVLADADENDDGFSFKYEGCRAVNPGSFPMNSTFMVYRPSTCQVEVSRIDWTG